MATTFSTSFKNRVIDCLTGRASSSQKLQYLVPYNGTQPADPTATPSGSPVYSSYTNGINFAAAMSAPGGGICALASPQQANANSTVASLTFARIYDNGGNAIIDTPVSLDGGGGGAILSALSSTATVALALNQFSFKIPLANGTVKISSSYANALAAALCNTPTTVGAFTSSTVNLYSGSAPASADDATTGTLLASFTLGSTSPWNVAVAGASTLGSNLTTTGVAAGTAGYARVVKSGGIAMQMSVGTSGTDLIVDTTSITVGGTVTLTGGTLSL